MAAPTETVLHSFTGGSDGANPNAGLIADSKGNLYGTTFQGGVSAYGTAFELSPPATAGGTWTETVLHSFTGGSDGANPYAGLIADTKGNLYGTTGYGGTSGAGVVYELSPPKVVGDIWTETILHSFTGYPNDGGIPFAGLTVDSEGNLYGMTQEGGTSYYGVVYELSPPKVVGDIWTETVLHSFTGYPNDGNDPLYGNLIADGKGNLYGTTAYGGSCVSIIYYDVGCGVVFELSPSATAGGSWTETVLHTFTGSPNDGSYPFAGLIADSKGNLYGMTNEGGTLGQSSGLQFGAGVVFELSPPATIGGTWTETVLHNFTGVDDGGQPYAGLIIDSKGNLYGTTPYRGPSYYFGVVFKLLPPIGGGIWTDTVLYNFNGGTDGAYPYAGLIADSKGNLYGTTYDGGASGNGTVFELTGTGFVTDIPFATFSSNLELQFGRKPNTDAFELLSEFTLGKTSTGVDPLTEPLTLTIGTYTTTLPAGSFRREWGGQYHFAGRINGADLEAALAQTGEKRFEFAASAQKADLSGTTNPVPVTLTIGNNTGTDKIELPNLWLTSQH